MSLIRKKRLGFYRPDFSLKNLGASLKSGHLSFQDSVPFYFRANRKSFPN